jgi:hypothetical protein
MTTPDAPKTPTAVPTWTPTTRVGTNYAAVSALVLGIVGFVLMAVPFFIGWFIGGIPDILAVIFGIIGLNNAGARRSVGKPLAIVGLVAGGVSLLSVLVGAGSVW